MKILTLTVLVLLSSCMSPKKVFLCGDTACANEKAAKKYFSENLILEIVKEKNVEVKKTDLITLNSNTSKKKANNFLKNNEQKLIKKELLEEKRQIKREQKLAKLRLKEEEKIIKEKKKENNRVFKKKNKNTIKNKNKKDSDQVQRTLNSVKKVNLDKQPCLTTNNCDIEKVIETLTKLGNKKDFPEINLK